MHAVVCDITCACFYFIEEVVRLLIVIDVADVHDWSIKRFLTHSSRQPSSNTNAIAPARAAEDMADAATDTLTTTVDHPIERYVPA